MLVGLALGLGLRLDAEGAGSLTLALLALIVNGLATTFNYSILGLGASGRDLPVIVLSRAVMLAGVAMGAWRGSLLLAMAGQLAGALTLAAGRALVVHRTLFRAAPPPRRRRPRSLQPAWTLDRRLVGLRIHLRADRHDPPREPARTRCSSASTAAPTA